MDKIKMTIRKTINEHYENKDVKAADIAVRMQTTLTAYCLVIKPDRYSTNDHEMICRKINKKNKMITGTFMYDDDTDGITLNYLFDREIMINNNLTCNGTEVNDINACNISVMVLNLQITQDKLSELSGISKSMISYHLAEKREMKLKHKIAYMTGIKRFIDSSDYYYH